MNVHPASLVRNRSFAVVGAVLLGTLLAGPVKAAPVDLPQYGFSIDALDGTPSPTAATTALMSFLPPSDGFAPNINVNIQPYTGDIASYAALSKGQFESMKWSLVSEKLVSSDEWVVEYTGSTQGTNLHFYARAIAKGGRVYLVTATAAETQWSAVSDVLRKHVVSFQVK